MAAPAPRGGGRQPIGAQIGVMQGLDKVADRDTEGAVQGLDKVADRDIEGVMQGLDKVTDRDIEGVMQGLERYGPSRRGKCYVYRGCI